jgi:hypothetical protein
LSQKILTPGTEHENAYVRNSAASAMAEAVEHWPRRLQQTLTTLEDFYREKVGDFSYIILLLLTMFQAKILAPEFDEYVSDIPSCATRLTCFL